MADRLAVERLSGRCWRGASNETAGAVVGDADGWKDAAVQAILACALPVEQGAALMPALITGT